MTDHNNQPDGFTPKTWLKTDFIQNWLLHLKEFPEKQSTGSLGFVEKDTGCLIGGCCLGVVQYLTKGEECLSEKDVHFIIASIPSQDTLVGQVYKTLFYDYKEYGLRDGLGGFPNPSPVSSTLASINDFTLTHPEIAEFIENNPERVFDPELLKRITKAPQPKIWTKDLIAKRDAA